MAVNDQENSLPSGTERWNPSQWNRNDPENPVNWKASKKLFITLVAVMLVLNSTMNSSLPSMAVPAIADSFGLPQDDKSVLPVSIFLVGFVCGPLLWGPLSEHLGRSRLSLAAFCGFLLGNLGCALAPSWASFLVFRLLCGVFGSAPVAIAPGMVADIHDEPRKRGKCMALYMVATLFGPLYAPIISGFTSVTIGWRWTFWVALILAAVTLMMLLFLPETYGPVLLARRAKRAQRLSPDVEALHTNKTDLSDLITVVFTRPVRMVLTEPLVTATCAYLSLVYAILYMSFQVFPLIFQDLYGLSPGITGLCYLPIGGGAGLSLPIFWFWDSFLAEASARSASWARREEMRRLPLALLGGPLFVISLFWLGFTSRESIPFVVPLLAGIPFGLGFMLIFMALLNYLTDAYDVFAASANAASSCCRSIVAVALPFATHRMFTDMGTSNACAILGGLAAGMCFIPYMFIWKGPELRRRSKFCLALRTLREERQGERMDMQPQDVR